MCAVFSLSAMLNQQLSDLTHSQLGGWAGAPFLRCLLNIWEQKVERQKNERRQKGREGEKRSKQWAKEPKPTNRTNKQKAILPTYQGFLALCDFFFKGSFSNVKETALSARMHRAVLDKCGRVYNRILRLTKVGRTTRRPRRRGKS